MNSRERVRAVIARQKVDHVPLGFYTVDYDTVEKVLGRKTFVRDKIRSQLALWEGRRDEVAESLKKDTVEFYRKIDCVDLILPKEASILPPKDYEPIGYKKLADDKFETGDGRIYHAVWDCNEIVCIHNPQPTRTEYQIDDFAEALPVKPLDQSRFEAVDYLIKMLGKERYIPSLVPTTALVLLGGTENGLLMYALEPEVICAAAKQQVQYQNAMDQYWVRPGSSGIIFDQDMAGTNGPLISPNMFREMVSPYFSSRVKHVKQFRDQLILHNCGNNIPLMEMFIEAGVDCYQSLQTTAGMEIGKLKSRFGNKMVFWGGVAVETLIAGTSSEVRAEVRTAMERGAVNNGFILGPSHSIAKNTKYDNFMAMLDEFIKLR
ncbi:MAG: hypothetical protein L3J71_08310 [Victivallaceae bacterium]|nr:hypothetical protein [Victivallaceae bacterium]